MSAPGAGLGKLPVNWWVIPCQSVSCPRSLGDLLWPQNSKEDYLNDKVEHADSGPTLCSGFDRSKQGFGPKLHANQVRIGFIAKRSGLTWTGNLSWCAGA